MGSFFFYIEIYIYIYLEKSVEIFSETDHPEKLKLVWMFPQVGFMFVQIKIPWVGWGHNKGWGQRFTKEYIEKNPFEKQLARKAGTCVEASSGIVILSLICSNHDLQK